MHYQAGPAGEGWVAQVPPARSPLPIIMLHYRMIPTMVSYPPAPNATLAYRTVTTDSLSPPPTTVHDRDDHPARHAYLSSISIETSSSVVLQRRRELQAKRDALQPPLVFTHHSVSFKSKRPYTAVEIFQAMRKENQKVALSFFEWCSVVMMWGGMIR